MISLKVEEVDMLKNNKQLTIEFESEHSYLLYAETENAENLQILYEYLSHLKTPANGNIYINDININYFSTSSYIKNIVTIIDGNNSLIQKNRAIMSYLLMATNDFMNVKQETLESVSSFDIIDLLIQEFEWDCELLKKRTKALDDVEKWKIKILETIVKKSKVLIVYKTLDLYPTEIIDFCIECLEVLLERYHLCIIILSENPMLKKKFKNIRYI